MDTSQPPHILPIPRLRLSRNSQYTPADAVPGPSRLPDAYTDLSGIDERDEASDSTPKLTPKSLVSQNEHSASTPAARLRALIANAPKPAQIRAEPPPKSPSLLESDFETTHPGSDKSSIANVKHIFSFALRDSGDSPQKSRHRRNSIDGSEVEGNPVKGSSFRDKGKRKSVSDEEVDGPSSPYQSSLRSSQATTFNNLREKLESSRTPLRSIPLSKIFAMDNDSQDTASLLRELNESTPPVATSTPQRSILIPLFTSQTSNLLEADSEMNRAMGALDALDQSVPFPSEIANEAPSTTPIPNGSTHPIRRHSADLHNLPKQSPNSSLHRSPSIPTNPSRRVSDGYDNSRTFPSETPDLKHRRSHGSFSSGGHSPGLSPTWAPVRRSLSRQSSAGSLLSQDDDFSSRASSVSSQAEYRERVRQQQQERAYEREREWNKPLAKDSRSSSSLGHHSHPRSRTQSASSRPTSASSFNSPDRSTKRLSFSSASSSDSHNRSLEDLDHGLDHERERNWGSPRPKWTLGHSKSMSFSGRPLSPAPPASGTPPGSPTARRRQESRVQTVASVPTSHSPLVPTLRGGNRPASPSPPDASLSRRRSADLSGRFSSSLASSRPKANQKENSAQSPGPSIPRSVSPFPRSRSPLPHAYGSPPSSALQHPESLVVSGSRPPSRTSGQSSRIPVRSLHKSAVAIPGLAVLHGEPRSTTAATSPSNEITGSSSMHHLGPEAPQSDVEDPLDSHEATPSLRTTRLPDDVPNLLPQSTVDETRLQKVLDIQALSPPPTPSSDEPKAGSLSPALVLSTPPRRPSFSSSRIEFQTPSPPKGLPDLPGPPPTSEDDTGDDENSVGQPMVTNFSMLKTPKPPGSWADTPAPEKPRFLSGSAPLDQPVSDPDTGLATPGPSLSRASTLPSQTPAPPGGWQPTPAPRKSILKVRFDRQSEAFPLSSQDEGSAADISSFPVKSPPTPPDETEELHNSAASVSSKPSRDEIPDADIIEPSIPPAANRPRRKVPSIRMLDAYGREIKIEEEPPNRPDHPSEKILDVMGGEVEDFGDSGAMSADESSILNHNEALNRVRVGLNDLAHDMSDVDRSMELSLDQMRLQELDIMSRAARETREKLSHTLDLARSSQEELRNKLAPLRASLRRSRLLVHDANPPFKRRNWNAWLFCGMVIVQAVLFLIMFRLANSRARHLFMTTYYDPFEPDLHLYAIKPDKPDLAISPPSWSILALRDSLYAKGWKYLISEVWFNMMDAISEWQKHAWELWGEESPRAWPPT